MYANPPEGGTLAVFGLGPVGQFAARIGKHWGRRVIGVDVVPERREMAARASGAAPTRDPERRTRMSAVITSRSVKSRGIAATSG